MQITYSGSEAYYAWRRAIPATDIIQQGIADGIADVAQAHMPFSPRSVPPISSPGRLVLGEYFAHTVGLHQQSLVGHWRGTFHTGRAGTHRGHGQTQRLGFVLEQAPDVGCGNMPFDDVATDRGGMAGAQLIGHPQLISGRRDVVYVVTVDLEAVLAQMLDPFPAANTGRTLEDLDGCRGLSQR